MVARWLDNVKLKIDAIKGRKWDRSQHMRSRVKSYEAFKNSRRKNISRNKNLFPYESPPSRINGGVPHWFDLFRDFQFRISIDHLLYY